jgi:hypothetical protein
VDIDRVRVSTLVVKADDLKVLERGEVELTLRPANHADEDLNV